MKYAVQLTARAERHLEHLDRWWRENRRYSSKSLEEQIVEVTANLGDYPTIRAVYARKRGRDIYRWRIGSTPYYLYYWVDGENAQVSVIAIWSIQKKKDPPL